MVFSSASPRAKEVVLTPTYEPSGSYVDATHYDAHPSSQPEHDRRNRVLSDAERSLAEHPREARESFSSIEVNDTKHWHLQSLEEVQKALSTDYERGLDESQHSKRLDEYGPNKLQEDPRAPVYVIFLLQFYNLIIAILLVAAIASFFLGKTVEGIAIFIIVTMNAIIATVQENNANNALEALAQLSSPLCTVMRGGEQIVVESDTLVPGDLVVLTTGDIVPADIRLIFSVDLKVNEMLLTGESEDVAKKYNAPRDGSSKKLTADNMVFSSTTVTTGNARGVVVETGMSTRVGSIAALLKNKTSDAGDRKKSWNPLQPCLEKYETKMTPLQESLHKLGALIGTFAVCVCALVFVLGLLRDIRDVKNPDRQQWITMVMVAVALAVSAVPSGLPMVVTICLSVGTAAMIKKNVLVRKLAAVETLGAASVICTDKTGTLTEGKMTAIKMWGDFTEYEITGKGFNPEGAILLNNVDQAMPGSTNVQVRATLLSCLLCSNTHLKQQDVDGVMTWGPQGNSSEAPLVVAAAKAGLWEDDVVSEYPRVVEVPFSSSRKMMITVNSLTTPGMFGALNLGDKIHYVASVKGAPNYILKNCTQYVQTDGTLATLSEQQRAKVMEAVDELSSQALRVLAVAIQPLPKLPFAQDCDDIDEKFAALSQPLVLMGLMASIDPERDGVREAIATARVASVRTVMITGDYLKTAVAIAKNIDLLGPDADPTVEATDCSRLRPRGDQYLPDHELDEITSRVVVFARAKPEDKIEIVKSLQRQGLVAAMTGDGVNDAPALKEADIGVAMGLAGTEVAKGASDMILLDDNFVSIVAAVERGRVIYANIQKFVIFLLSTNIGEILLIFGAVALACPLPMEPLQILMVNLFTDGMPGAALSMERGETTIMSDKPRPKSQPLIHGRLWKVVLFNAVFIAACVFSVFMLGVYWNFGVVFLKDILAQGAGQTKIDGATSYLGVTCERWMGFGNDWKTYGNCGAKFSDGTFVFPGLENEIKFENATIYCEGGEYTCMWEGIARSQTMTFIAMTFTEVFRAYTVRNLAQVMFIQMFTNGHLQAAVIASILLTVFITNTPVIMDDIFGFGYITWFQWFVAFLGAVVAAFCGEILKWIMRVCLRRRTRREETTAQLESILLEMRHMRQRFDRLELAHQPAKN